MSVFKAEKITSAVSALSCFAALSFGPMAKAAAAPPEPPPAAAPSTSGQSLEINELHLANFRSRLRRSKIDTIVLHSMCAPAFADSLSLENCIKTLRKARVGPHYIIDREGGIHQYAPENIRAPHAGASRMPFKDDKRRHVSEFSIGIEIISGRGVGFTDAQYRALGSLLNDLTERHAVRSIVGHSEVALPRGRRWDPDALFDWSRVREYLGLKASNTPGIRLLFEGQASQAQAEKTEQGR